MTLGYNSPLYLLPLDHRHSYVTGMFQFTAPLTADEHNTVAESKRVIYEGFRQALSRGADENKVVRWLETAASVPGFIGFAVGRTTLWDAVADYEARRVTRHEAVRRVAHRYREWASIVERTHPLPQGHA